MCIWIFMRINRKRIVRSRGTHQGFLPGEGGGVHLPRLRSNGEYVSDDAKCRSVAVIQGTAGGINKKRDPRITDVMLS